MPTSDKKRGEYVPLSPNQSLHHQKCKLNQLEHIKTHCEQWIEYFRDLLSVTNDAASVRTPDSSGHCDTDHYRLKRQGSAVNEKSKEIILERALWGQWGKQRFLEKGCWFIEGICKYIQTYQLPLKDKQADDWGRVDLVGVSECNLPVVLELKKEEGDCLLWAMAEALGYALCVKKTWMQTEQNDHGLRAEWVAAINEREAKQLLPKSLTTVPIVIIGPQAYWEHCIGLQGKRRRHQIASEAWPSIQQLIECFNSCGYPIFFVAFNTEDGEADLPRILAPRLVHLPH